MPSETKDKQSSGTSFLSGLLQFFGAVCVLLIAAYALSDGFQVRANELLGVSTVTQADGLPPSITGTDTTPAAPPEPVVDPAKPPQTTPQTTPAAAAPAPKARKKRNATWAEAKALQSFLLEAAQKKLGIKLKPLPARKALRARYRAQGRAPRIFFCFPRKTCNRKSAKCQYGYWVKRVKKEKGEQYDHLQAHQVHRYPSVDCPEGLTDHKQGVR